jgi:hypothetical protein
LHVDLMLRLLGRFVHESKPKITPIPSP